MTDAYLMEANCVHGVVWYECSICTQDAPRPPDDVDVEVPPRSTTDDEFAVLPILDKSCDPIVYDEHTGLEVPRSYVEDVRDEDIPDDAHGDEHDKSWNPGRSRRLNP